LQIIKKHFPNFNWSFDTWRAGDQRVYISDVSKAERDFGWTPKVSADQGIAALINWASEQKDTLPPL
jgi:CDP-paratose 2-epimerase